MWWTGGVLVALHRLAEQFRILVAMSRSSPVIGETASHCLPSAVPELERGVILAAEEQCSNRRAAANGMRLQLREALVG